MQHGECRSRRIDFEQSALAVGSAPRGDAVQEPVTSLDHSGLRILALDSLKVVQLLVTTTAGRHHEHGPEPVRASPIRSAIELSVRGLQDRASRISAVGASTAKAVKNLQDSFCRQPEHCALIKRSTVGSCAVEVSVRAQNERCNCLRGCDCDNRERQG